MFELADPIPNMDSMGHFQVSSTYSQRVLKLMKFWSNLGLVRTLKLASLKKIVRSVFEISVFELADPIPNMDSMGHFQVSSTYSQRVLKLMKFWSNLGLVRTLKLGEFKENRSLSFRDIGVRDSRRHSQYGQYGPFSS